LDNILECIKYCRQLSRAYKAAIEVTLKSIDEYSTSLQHSQVMLLSSTTLQNSIFFKW